MSDAKQLFREGQAHATSEAKAEESVESVKETVRAAEDKTVETVQHIEENEEEAAGFTQKARKEIQGMARGAVVSLKSTHRK